MSSWKRRYTKLRCVATSLPAALTDVTLNRKRSHRRKEAPAAASHAWSSTPSDQRTKAHLFLIHLSQRRRGRSVTSAHTAPKGPSAPTAFALVRSSAPVWGQLSSYLKKTSDHHLQAVRCKIVLQCNALGWLGSYKILTVSKPQCENTPLQVNVLY